MTALLVFLGSAAGASLRYLADRFVRSRYPSPLPWATLAVNVAGCFALGWLVGAEPAVWALAGTGVCGGLSTYSTFGYETVALLERERYGWALANVLANVVVGVGAAALGWWIGR
ncbi:fluoride efflux transporter CrcB [Saccharothrix coeruleofusca]|uniref:Fluoride-specific ion channel FluC n=1 Tax=Saccharothrix coeruleofusca TaxID=33919 RepID=A0A918AH92_9PSEU|nr:fluoride efflux transporter CrcB [Saccharothrix coeruleofusca]MBP2334319.1 CrcB protein [Saccharothrix coeruleofusca]GGP41869.1 putative fluoride ion transporter CrcB [Saccharothrix coeruleofusca]